MPGEKEYRLEIDPNILKLLGPNLYTNIYYVLAELIANAYDANANNVYIIDKGHAIIVEDDGKGMSYESGEIRHYLDVAKETRINNEDTYTSGAFVRKKMGRKGVGKLAALSVSENVKIMTKSNNELSGFIMSRSVPSTKLLTPIQEDEIVFEKIAEQTSGTSVVMMAPEYHLHKTHNAIRRNLLKIFPMVNNDFKIHIIIEDQEIIINSFEKEMFKELGTLELIGEDFYPLEEFYTNPFPHEESSEKLFVKSPAIKDKLVLKNKYGEEKEYIIELKGWIGTYKSTKGRKTGDKTDFPDNFISLFANQKLGEFNILPIIGKNRMVEVFVVGQLHIDLFEETELSDMALSNRQGYKSEDPRYQWLLTKADKILSKALSIRSKYTDLNRGLRNTIALEKQKEKDQKLNQAVKDYKEAFKNSLSRNIQKISDNPIPENVIQEITEETSNETINLLGIKNDADKNRKKILLSQTEDDKPLSDLIYETLLFNNIPKEDILYSNCDDIEARLPLRTNIYDYLRKLFVETYSEEKLYIIYVTSHNMDHSWGCHMEAGAGWVLKNEYCIFNCNNYSPKEPLRNGEQWQTSTVSEDGIITMDQGNVCIFADYIEHLSLLLGYNSKTKDEICDFLSQRIDTTGN